jgi:long-chain acyl-CoA synthetase
MFPFEARYPDKRIAVITDEGTSFTFGDIRNFGERIHKVISRRCLVFCLSQNTTGSLFGYISFLSGSIVPVMLDSDIDPVFLEMLIKTYSPHYLWLPDNRLSEFANCEIVFSAYNYSLVKVEEESSPALHPDLALLLTTSGSTGSAKLVRISYENLKSNTKAISSYLSVDEQERAITTLPMWYSYGLSVINCHLFKGATILLTSKSIVEKDFWNFIRSEKASSLSGVPYTYQILKKLKFSGLSLPSLKTLTQAGGKLNEDVNQYISEYAFTSGKRFFVMYGQTEATARMSYLPPEFAVKKTGSIGLPLPGGEFHLMDDSGNEIQEAGLVGELVYRGKNVSMGYSQLADDLIKGDENKGVLFTGDLAKRDEDNFYYIAGRKNRFVKLFGNRINLEEAEDLLRKVIPDCACTGSEDNLSIYITDKSRLEDIKNYFSSKTGIHPSAFSVQQCDEIPRNTVGKINYSRLNTL